MNFKLNSKRSQQYILLFLTMIIIFFLIFLSNVILRMRDKTAESVGKNLKTKPYDSIYALLDAPLILHFPAYDEKNRNYESIASKRINLLTIFTFKNKISTLNNQILADQNHELLEKLINKYETTFKAIFEEDILCIEIALDTGNRVTNFEKLTSYDNLKCKRNEGYIVKIGDYLYRISIVIDKKYLLKEGMNYVNQNT